MKKQLCSFYLGIWTDYNVYYNNMIPENSDDTERMVNVVLTISLKTVLTRQYLCR